MPYDRNLIDLSLLSPEQVQGEQTGPEGWVQRKTKTVV